MLKCYSYDIVCQEIPDEITLCINISGCKNACQGCHSPYLAEDIGEPLGYWTLDHLIKSNKGITCVCFMGGSKEPNELSRFAKLIKENTDLKVAWYSGDNFDIENPFANVDIRWFDYIKLGPYIPECGPLNQKTTNQRMYLNTGLSSSINRLIGWKDITYKFWKNDTQN